MISKSDLAALLDMNDSDLSLSVYQWAIKQFFLSTGLKEADEQKTDTKFVNTSTLYFKLKNTNIKSIDTIKVDNEEQDFTLFSDLKFNPDTGLVYYSGGFGGGQLVEITYTINGYTHRDIHDYLVAILAAKALSIFTPDKIQQVKMVRIGKFQKQFGAASSNLEDYQKTLDDEIDRVVDLINEDDGKMTLGQVL